jgi:hypothetical protein
MKMRHEKQAQRTATELVAENKRKRQQQQRKQALHDACIRAASKAALEQQIAQTGGQLPILIVDVEFAGISHANVTTANTYVALWHDSEPVTVAVQFADTHGLDAATRRSLVATLCSEMQQAQHEHVLQQQQLQLSGSATSDSVPTVVIRLEPQQ